MKYETTAIATVKKNNHYEKSTWHEISPINKTDEAESHFKKNLYVKNHSVLQPLFGCDLHLDTLKNTHFLFN